MMRKGYWGDVRHFGRVCSDAHSNNWMKLLNTITPRAHWDLLSWPAALAARLPSNALTC
jgi:hypothetical protein